MQILLALIAGVVVGFGAHFAVGGRDTRGAGLAPVFGAAIAGVVWTAMTWAGAGIDTPWIWLASFAAPAVVLFPLLPVLTRRRLRDDEAERARLRIG
ncbi:hypothetical protein NQ166_06555 [Microbacterium sp. zg.Y1090]|uniref:hypothetical protein n=1 Tax=Microbacterium TaxID=33882 RepID=UPI00214B36D0|nr:MULTISPECIES: hypothetical protein [unclassified Microbacterium]MCR2812061.1 hypothetical protein [Microbacterium sp. zg.Y1084]MCR2818500.1 hypothetical protein [Microbacterium sp. zg.Y1090]MDL5486313.1 hypothetical protein [Microbacterium sp. zg-Y1211]WIM29508.1 hypothetical protein QNO26_06365 [Microbacterium sp. zg-Y1090]